MDLMSGEDFYSILGVHPTARPREIKQAYYNLMREHHPDQATNSGFDSTAFCALLNQIHQTLSDPDARAMYDAVAGFSVDAVNPFTDTSFPANEIFVDEVNCIGCGKCVRACPDAFFIESSKYGRARVVPGVDALGLQDEVEVAMLTCPVDCIHWVTSPQLSMLEATLEAMDRVDAFIMLRNHRSPGNVFEEAARAWQKRQAAIATMRAQQDFAAAGGNSNGSASGFAWVSFWSQHVDFKSSSSSSSGSGSSSADDEGDVFNFRDPAARRLVELAAAATKAMRRWNMYKRLHKPLKALPDGHTTTL